MSGTTILVPREHSALSRYGVAVVSVAVALVLRFALDRFWEDRQPFATFYLAILIASGYGGLGAGILALAGGYVLADWFFTQPRFTLNLLNPSFPEGINIAIYFGVGGSIVYTIESLHRSRQRLWKATLQEQARRTELEALLAAVPAVVWIEEGSQCRVLGGKLPKGFQVFKKGRMIPEDEMPLRRSARTGTPVLNEELEVRSPEGSSQWMFGNAVPLLDEKGVVRGALGAFVDTTELKRTGDELRISEAMLREQARMLELAHIFVRDTQDKILYWNRGAELFYGYSQEEALGRVSHELLRTRFSEPLESIMAKLRSGHDWEGELFQTKRDGSEIIVASHWTGFCDTQGNLAATIQVSNDITARKQAEQALREAKDGLEMRVQQRTVELVEVNRTLETVNRALEAEISERKGLEREILEVTEREQRRVGQDLHDGLGQLLRGIAYLSHVLQENLSSRSLPEAKDAARITQLLNEAIVQSRSMARGLFPVKMEADGLMSALHELAARIENTFKISCRFECPSPVLIHDTAAAIHLFRIAQEAVNNAIQHSKGSRIGMALAATSGAVTLSIDDNGQGLPADVEKHKGMGLKIMNYRARSIGGVLNLRRATGGGTRVICFWQTERDRPQRQSR